MAKYHTYEWYLSLPQISQICTDTLVASNGLIHINSHSKENMHELGFNFLYPMLLAITVYASSAEFLLGQFPSPASLSDGADGECTGK